MNVLVVGSGRLGARVASALAEQGHRVTVVDRAPTAFHRLPDTFSGQSLVGDGTDIEVLERAGIREADIVLALTHSNNANIMIAQVASRLYGVKQVVAEALDPERVRVFDLLGVPYVNPFELGIQAVLDRLQLVPPEPAAGG
jgi:trk system potassium uptake protein TrkA